MDDKQPSKPARSAYVLRVVIKDIKPPIRRKLSVPGDYTLGDLHYILQAAFDWEDDHMHSFTVNSEEYGRMSLDDYAMDEDDVCLNELDLRPKQKFTYLYDFGDSWLHEITVSKIVPVNDIDDKNEDLTRPRCLEGERAGPMEDSGGPWGYADMLEILKDPNHKDYENIYEWAGDFDPEYFSLGKVNARLEVIFKPQPKKPKKSSAGKTKKPK